MKFHLGTNSEKVVLPILEKAKEEIFVCSPFLSPKYARIMEGKAEQGIKVDVVTTDTGASYHKEALRILEGPKRPRSSWVALFVLAGVFAALSAFFVWFLIIMGLFAVGGYYSRKRYKEKLAFWEEGIKKRKVNVIRDNKVHAKFYSTDGRIVAVGSPNLTSTGLQKHVEYIELKREDVARELIENFRNKLLG